MATSDIGLLNVKYSFFFYTRKCKYKNDHAEVLIGDAPVYMSDNLSQTKLGNSNVQVLIECESQEQIERWYAAAEMAGC